MRQDLTHLLRWIQPEARVLDLGCGDGEFMLRVQKERNARVTGIEIDADAITSAISKGLDIVEQDLDQGLANFRDQSFDVVVMAHALQAVHYPHLVLDEMLRIGRECVVTFPNFGHWRSRLHLVTRGRMPVSRFMPYTWYDTPNIHFCTVRDFETLCRQRDIRILGRETIDGDRERSLLARRWPNLFATTAIYHISR
ncbi:MAG: methionine biosynthesis protein MetW [Congregibacter sp.]